MYMESGLGTENSGILQYDDFEERTYKKVLSNYNIFIKTHLSPILIFFDTLDRSNLS